MKTLPRLSKRCFVLTAVHETAAARLIYATTVLQPPPKLRDRSPLPRNFPGLRFDLGNPRFQPLDRRRAAGRVGFPSLPLFIQRRRLVRRGRRGRGDLD